jgi:GMP synthase (glutamine-hydrolysing)
MMSSSPSRSEGEAGRGVYEIGFRILRPGNLRAEMPGKHVRVIQHVASEGPGRIGTALAELGLEVRVTRIDRGEPVPETLDGASGLLVMGGPMGVYEQHRYPHLRDELRLIGVALASNAPVLGICLGSQLVAAALGARVVFSGRKEIGWMPVTREPGSHEDALLSGLPDRFEALHWHGDVFDLPQGAVSLAHSELTTYQAFRHGTRTYGLLFHLEADAEHVRAMATAFAAELSAAGVDPQALLAQTAGRDAAAATLASRVFGAWGKLVV